MGSMKTASRRTVHLNDVDLQHSSRGVYTGFEDQNASCRDDPADLFALKIHADPQASRTSADRSSWGQIYLSVSQINSYELKLACVPSAGAVPDLPGT